MELRVLKYFLSVAKEQNFSKAAQQLFITQPTLSRQIKELEEELGTTLFFRGTKNKKVTLTEAGLHLKRRAEEILALSERTKSEFSAPDTNISGDIYIGGGETAAMNIIAKAITLIRQKHPHIVFHLLSGNADEISEKLDNGLLDFGIFIDPAPKEKYHYLSLPAEDTWGLLMKKNNDLAQNEHITPEDLKGIPLIISRQSLISNVFSAWLGNSFEALNIVADYNLLYNASLLVHEETGCALCLDKLVHTGKDSELCFVPLWPPLKAQLNIVWKKNAAFSKPAEKFLEQLKTLI